MHTEFSPKLDLIFQSKLAYPYPDMLLLSSRWAKLLCVNICFIFFPLNQIICCGYTNKQSHNSVSKWTCSPTPCLTLFRPMEFSIKLHAIKSGWSIVYIEGLQIIISKNCTSLIINFVSENSEDPYEMPHNVAFHLGLHCLTKYPFRGFQSPKGQAKTWHIFVNFQYHIS